MTFAIQISIVSSEVERYRLANPTALLETECACPLLQIGPRCGRSIQGVLPLRVWALACAKGHQRVLKLFPEFKRSRRRTPSKSSSVPSIHLSVGIPRYTLVFYLSSEPLLQASQTKGT